MKLKKHLRMLFSFLLVAVFLLTGCSPAVEELATDVITTIIESELEAEVEDGDIAVLEEELFEDSLAVEEETIVDEEPVTEEEPLVEESKPSIDENGTYTSKEEVAAYLNEYGHLPSNFITKKQAKKLGWVSSEGNLGKVAPGKSIGGDYFGNYEGNLPEAKGRDYYECDIDSTGKYRGAKRIVYSNDGLIYYTEDHYETFELLYGEE